MKRFLLLLRHDLRLALRQASDGLTVLTFFLLAVSLFPLGVGPEPALLAWIAPGILWVGALLAALLSLDRLYQSDLDDGTLELLLTSDAALPALALARACAHWLTTGLPLTLLAGLLAGMLGMAGEAIPPLLLGLLLGTPSLSLLGSLGAALIVGARRAGPLIPLLILPLCVPVLIFGVAAGDLAAGSSAEFPLTVLAALLLGTLALAPWGIAAALRAAGE
ncbi:MAG: heme exporter protein CcmB [Reyranellaceae bacterium]